MMKKFDKTDFNKKDGRPLLEFLIYLKNEKIIKDFFYDDNFVLINGECIDTMSQLIKNNTVVNHIISDIPYGTIQNLTIEGWKKKNTVPTWDKTLDLDEMLNRCFYISKTNANLLLFSQERLTTDLIKSLDNFQKYSLSNKLIWVKNNHANGFNSKTTPLNYYEEILLIRKSLDETNSVKIREYFKNLLEKIPDTKKEIMNKLGQGLDHCFRFANRTFYIPTRINYDKLIESYNIDSFDFFIPYDNLKMEWEKENKVVFNIPKNQKIVKNVLEFGKDQSNIHPTQKPLKLLRFLIKTFTNKNDVVLDFTSGSGSTGIACIKEKRKFIGIEIDENFYKQSIEWYLKEKLNN